MKPDYPSVEVMKPLHHLHPPAVLFLVPPAAPTLTLQSLSKLDIQVELYGQKWEPEEPPELFVFFFVLFFLSPEA